MLRSGVPGGCEVTVMSAAWSCGVSTRTFSRTSRNTHVSFTGKSTPVTLRDVLRGEERVEDWLDEVVEIEGRSIQILWSHSEDHLDVEAIRDVHLLDSSSCFDVEVIFRMTPEDLERPAFDLDNFVKPVLDTLFTSQNVSQSVTGVLFPVNDTWVFRLVLEKVGVEAPQDQGQTYGHFTPTGYPGSQRCFGFSLRVIAAALPGSLRSHWLSGVLGEDAPGRLPGGSAWAGGLLEPRDPRGSPIKIATWPCGSRAAKVPTLKPHLALVRPMLG